MLDPRFGLVLVLTTAALLCACSTDSTDGAPKHHASYRSICAEDRYCGGQRCVDNSCTAACEADSDCGDGKSGDWTCGIAADASRVCVPPCGTEGYACIDSVSTACELADDTACETCGCPEATRCEPGVGCEPRREVGQPCAEDADCASSNCDAFDSVCFVALGAACDATNCQRCLSDGDWTFCTRHCSNASDCTKDTVCTQEGSIIDNYCEPRCQTFNDPTCPSSCEGGSTHNASESHLYCKCLTSEGCTVL